MRQNIIRISSTLGLTWVIPICRLIWRENPRHQLRELRSLILVPLLAVLAFLGMWSVLARQVNTSLGTLPGPLGVYREFRGLVHEHTEERAKEKAFYARQEDRIAAALREDPHAEAKRHTYTGKPTFIDQIGTSLETVFAGFLFASVIAVPIGLLCGMSRTVMHALNPLIQVFKPVSPLAWLPIVTMIVSAVYATRDGFFPKCFLISAITVSLCSLWPSILNTALGVASVDKDFLNVARVLKLGWFTQVWKIILPASLPLVFTGLRISLGVGWMVLIASEMLAQNPGLGKFVWDEFQNGSSNSLARIMVAVLVIGFIGFVLDRIMVALQKLTDFQPGAA